MSGRSGHHSSDADKRVYELQIEIGHKSSPLSKKLTNGYTHKWTAFVKGVNENKIEHCIQKVVFQLHETFDNPLREIYEPPYQIKETGYAGFEIPISIYFRSKDKPNYASFVHDLNLLTNKEDKNSTVEKIKLCNPNREFEKLLIKSGAQLLNAGPKKSRSDSPPTKKQKSSSLIPSKDLSNKTAQTHTSHVSSTHSSHSNKAPQATSSSHEHFRNNSNNQSNKQFLPPQKDIVNLFGLPLVYNNKPGSSSGNSNHNSNSSSSSNHNNNNNTINTTNTTITTNNNHASGSSRDLSSRDTTSSNSGSRDNSSFRDTNASSKDNNTTSNSSSSHNSNSTSGESSKSDLQMIQARIACLNDRDRLQKIVDIVEDSGEWFNLTSKKFEFDLKRLDKKTLTRIEKCLH